MHCPDPGARLRDIAASLGITERSAYGIITDLTTAGYVMKQKYGRRNRYQIQAHLRQPEPASREPAIGDVLAVLAVDGASALTGSRPAQAALKCLYLNHGQTWLLTSAPATMARSRVSRCGRGCLSLRSPG